MIDIHSQVKSIQDSLAVDPRFKKFQEDMPITDNALEGVNKLFNSILPHFPAWRQSCPTDDDLSRLKLVWTKSLMRQKQKTGKNINMKAGITACEESDSDWLPSVGKFIKMCEQGNDLLVLAERALDLFNNAQKQIDSVGQMVVAKHKFDLKAAKASDTNKRFIELYLRYSADNDIQPLEAFAIAETVQLSEEQKKDADNRCAIAQNEFLKSMHGLVGKSEPKTEFKTKSVGIQKGKIYTQSKTPKQLEDEKQRQLQMIKDKL